jgi:hypothetical protein
VSELAAALDEALKASGWQALLVAAAGAATLPADLAGFGLVLLAGLQSPAAPLSLEPAQEAADQSIRAALAQGALAYRVLYGTPDERLAHALHAVESLLAPVRIRPSPKDRAGNTNNQPWVWLCDKCRDPQCEHKLLTALLAQRDSTGRRTAFNNRASY